MDNDGRGLNNSLPLTYFVCDVLFFVLNVIKLVVKTFSKLFSFSWPFYVFFDSLQIKKKC